MKKKWRILDEGEYPPPPYKYWATKDPAGVTGWEEISEEEFEDAMKQGDYDERTDD